MKRNKVEYWDDEVEEFKGKPEILPPAPKEEKTVNINLGFGETGFSPREDRFWNRFFLILAAIAIIGTMLFSFGFIIWAMLL